MKKDLEDTKQNTEHQFATKQDLENWFVRKQDVGWMCQVRTAQTAISFNVSQEVGVSIIYL